MKGTKKTRRSLANAIVWAAMIIASALLMKGSEHSQTMLLILIAGWFSAQGLILGSTHAARDEWLCIKRRLGWSNDA